MNEIDTATKALKAIQDKIKPFTEQLEQYYAEEGLSTTTPERLVELESIIAKYKTDNKIDDL